MADFYTTEFSVVLAAATTAEVLTAGVHYTIPDGLLARDCLVWISDSRRCGMGRTSGGGNQQPSDHGVWIGASSDVVNSITLRRNNTTGTMNCRVTLSILCVTNPLSPSRFWVRDRGALSLASGVSSASGSAPTGDDAVLDSSKVWVAVTGQQSDATARGLTHRGKFTSDFVGGAAELTRGITGDAAMVSYAVVEWGPDWSVQRIAFTTTSVGGSPPPDVWRAAAPDQSITQTITGAGGTALADWTRTLLDPQFRNEVAANQGNDDQGEVLELAGNDALTVRKSVNANESDKHHVAWLLAWAGHAKATPPTIQWVSEHQSPGAVEEEAINRTITAVASIENASCFGSSVSSDGTGNGTPRGHVDFRLSSTTNVVETRSEAGREERRAYQVVEWPIGYLGERGSRSEAAHAGSQDAQPATAGSLRAEPAVPGSAEAQSAVAGSLRAESAVAGSLASQASPVE